MSLDEDGRCVRTGLLPDGCACPEHRAVDDEAVLRATVPYAVARKVEARYAGKCSLNAQHRWEPGEEIAMAKRSEDDVEIGWICEACADEAGKW